MIYLIKIEFLDTHKFNGNKIVKVYIKYTKTHSVENFAVFALQLLSVCVCVRVNFTVIIYKKTAKGRARRAKEKIN